MYLPALRHILSQGDIFIQLDFIDSAAPMAPKEQHNVIVLSHTCEILKPGNAVVLVSAIRLLSEVNSGLRGLIKKNQVYNAMYLEPVGPLEESFVDFRYTFRANKVFLKESMERNLRIASFNEESQLGLATFFYRFLVRKLPTK